ncbi:hypothetical protein P7C71_g935, partial [Lecanoromycetidae sp. Uapishka_2]
MDPLSVLSLTSTIVQFIDFGFKVTKRLTEYANAGIDDIPQTLETIANQLPLLLNALERVKTNLTDNKLDYDTRCILRGVVAGCMVQVGRVDKIMDKVLCVEGDSKATRVRKAVKSLGSDDKLAAIEKNLQIYISVLILHHVIDDTVAAPLLTAETTYFEVPIAQASPFYDRDDMLEKIDLHLEDVKTSQVASPVSVALHGKPGVVRGRSKPDMALLLLEAGANVNKVIKDGRTPLIRSIECSEVSMARLLVRHGARADIPDADGDLPLTLAASKGYHLLVRDLVRSGTAPDVKNRSGATALCIAAARGHKNVVQELLDGCARRDLPNKYGETALDLAEENKHNDIVKLLKSR